MSSILTNNGAMVALQTLKGINANLAKTQDQISTGKAVATAKDNAAIWAIAKTMESEVGGMKSISTSLSMGAQAVGTARQAAETVTNLLEEVRNVVVQAQDGNVDRATLDEDIKVLRDQIKSVVASSQFNGKNLVNGSETGYNVLSSMVGGATAGTPGKIAVTLTNLSVDGATPGVLAALETLTVTGADDAAATTAATAAMTSINTMIGAAKTAAQTYGAAGKRIDIQADFISKLSDSMKSGVGALVDANMEETSARLQALQTQQQLGLQSLSIANQAPQSILSLFR
ncbi:flagellin [Paracoccus sp. Z118]|nr:flagellin [Paracoccus sp. Z118]MBV0890307.1 flagellin [Paracoccus sp. Z118]